MRVQIKQISEIKEISSDTVVLPFFKDLKKFEIEIGNRQTPSSPELIQEAVEISRECSRFEVMKILQENQKNEINPDDTI